MDKRLLREFKTVETMVKIYCKKTHVSNGSHSALAPCVDCSELINYAAKRLDACKFGVNKPVCAKCKVHCYKPEMRTKIRQVMRVAGPRMLYKHPVMLINHIIDMMRY